MWSEKLYDSEKIKAEILDLKSIYPNAPGLNLPKIDLFSIQKPLQIPVSQGFLIWTIRIILKNEDAETPSFPKLQLEIFKCIVYNQIRNNQRIFAVSDDCHRKLINKVYELHRLLPIAVGGSQFTFYGDCRDMLRLQKQLTATSKFLTYSYVLLSVPGKYNHQTIPTLF